MQDAAKEPPIRMRGDRWTLRRDGALCLCLFLLFAVGGYAYLRAYGIIPSVRHGDGDMFVPAIGVAAGMGYSDVAPDAPGVGAFLSRESMTLDLAPLRDPELYRPATGKFALDRVYLLYALGLVWRVTGVSWHTAFVLNAAMFGCCAVLVYLIFRLGMRPLLSVAGTLLGLFSPVYIQMLPAMRDFCKAPFILATMLFCGLLLTGRIRGKMLLPAAGLMGLVLGIGVGFRQDSIICLPMAVAFLTVFNRGSRWRWRMAGVAMLLLGFLPAASPIFRMNAETGGNNAFYVTQGFTADCYNDLDLDRPAYTPLYTHSDYIVHAYICHYGAARGLNYAESAKALQAAQLLRGALLGQVEPLNLQLNAAAQFPVDSMLMWSYGAEMIARLCAAELIATFPADVLTRAYGAVFKMLRGVNSTNNRGEASDDLMTSFARLRAPIIDHLQGMGPLYATIVFLLLASRNVWFAFGALALVLYFLGYPSIEFQMRHAFHLSFIAFWFPLFLLQTLWSKWRGRREMELEELTDAPAGLEAMLPGERQLAPLRKALSFLAAVSMMFALPLWAAREWQQRQVSPILDAYADADLEPLRTREEPQPMGVLHLPDGAELFAELQGENALADLLPPLRAPDFAVEYFAADLECSGVPVGVRFRYESIESYFEGGTDYRPDPERPQQTMRLFFPAFQFSDHFAAAYPQNIFPKFRGLELPEGMRLKQLYRVRNPRDFPFLMTMWLGEDRSAWRDAYTLRMAPQ
jgi:hypothetical protein